MLSISMWLDRSIQGTIEATRAVVRRHTTATTVRLRETNHLLVFAARSNMRHENWVAPGMFLGNVSFRGD